MHLILFIMVYLKVIITNNIAKITIIYHLLFTIYYLFLFLFVTLTSLKLLPFGKHHIIFVYSLTYS